MRSVSGWLPLPAICAGNAFNARFVLAIHVFPIGRGLTARAGLGSVVTGLVRIAGVAGVGIPGGGRGWA